jgi:hypothetical protein
MFGTLSEKAEKFRKECDKTVNYRLEGDVPPEEWCKIVALAVGGEIEKNKVN